MNKIIFSILALTALPMCAMDVPQQGTVPNEEFPLWQFKKMVELWPTFAAEELSDSEKQGILSDLKLPKPEEDPIRNDWGYEKAFYAYVHGAITSGSAFTNIQRVDLLGLQTAANIIMKDIEEECTKKLGPSCPEATAAQYQEALRIALGYQPRILELLKDIKDPYETSETADAKAKSE
jgi:hypothetical protein